MCFSQLESIAALIVGTVINIVILIILVTCPAYASVKWPRVAIVCLWQFAILMQIPEAIQWRSIDRKTPTPPYVNALAYWFNVLQPAVAFLGIASALVASHTTHMPTLLIASVMPILFTIVAGWYYHRSMNHRRDITPLPACAHLDLHWWRGDLAPLLGLYMAAVMSAIVLVPDYQRYVQLSVFIGTFLLANAMYSCGTGSIWCWMIAPASLTLLI